MATQATKITSILQNLSEWENQQRVAALAYNLWLARGFRRGSPETDWLRADRLIRGTSGKMRLRRTPVGYFLVPEQVMAEVPRYRLLTCA
jgi:hypothetical protein